MPITIDTDPTETVSISAPTDDPSRTYGYLCNPSQSAPGTLPGVTDLTGFTATYHCTITSTAAGDLELPLEAVSYTERGCYVETPNTLTAIIAADEDISTDLAARLDDGDIEITRQRTDAVGNVFTDSIADVNFDDWKMTKTAEKFTFELTGTRQRTYSSPKARTVASASIKAGDFSDYASDKLMTVNGMEATFISPGDYVNYAGEGLYVDLLVAQITERGIAIDLTQFGRA